MYAVQRPLGGPASYKWAETRLPREFVKMADTTVVATLGLTMVFECAPTRTLHRADTDSSEEQCHRGAGMLLGYEGRWLCVNSWLHSLGLGGSGRLSVGPDLRHAGFGTMYLRGKTE